MIKYYVQSTLYNSNGRAVQTDVGLMKFRSTFYSVELDAKAFLYESVSMLVANGFDIISPEGALSTKLMCPDGLHVIRLEVVRCLEIEGVMLRKS